MIEITERLNASGLNTYTSNQYYRSSFKINDTTYLRINKYPTKLDSIYWQVCTINEDWQISCSSSKEQTFDWLDFEDYTSWDHSITKIIQFHTKYFYMFWKQNNVSKNLWLFMEYDEVNDVFLLETASDEYNKIEQRNFLKITETEAIILQRQNNTETNIQIVNILSDWTKSLSPLQTVSWLGWAYTPLYYDETTDYLYCKGTNASISIFDLTDRSNFVYLTWFDVMENNSNISSIIKANSWNFIVTSSSKKACAFEFTNVLGNIWPTVEDNFLYASSKFNLENICVEYNQTWRTKNWKQLFENNLVLSLSSETYVSPDTPMNNMIETFRNWQFIVYWGSWTTTYSRLVDRKNYYSSATWENVYNFEQIVKEVKITEVLPDRPTWTDITYTANWNEIFHNTLLVLPIWDQSTTLTIGYTLTTNDNTIRPRLDDLIIEATW